MANSDKNIKITPNISQTAQPNVVFTGQGNVPITLKVLDDAYGTLSFEGSSGQLFSINNNLTSGVIFSVNDVSGVPMIDVDASGLVRLAPLGGTVYSNTLYSVTKTVAGAGNSLTLKAGDGLTSGAGGNVVLQPGTQATTGGDGSVTIEGPSTSSVFLRMRGGSGSRYHQFKNNVDASSLQIGRSDHSSFPLSFTVDNGYSRIIGANSVIGFGYSTNLLSLQAGEGSSQIIRLNNRIDNNSTIGGLVQFWTRTSQPDNAIEVVSPGGSSVLLSVNANGSISLLPYGTSAGNTNELRFVELAANGTNYVGFKGADSIAGNVIWTLPLADGTNGQLLSTNGSGTLSWASGGGSGTVTSVSGTGTVNGITLTGTVTSSGSLTLGGSLSGINLASQVTGTLPIANGGTGATTATAAFDAISPTSTLGDIIYENTGGTATRLAGNITATKQFLSQTGTGTVSAAPAWAAIAAADVPTLNQNTTGTASGSVSGTASYVPKFTSANVIGNSLIYDSGTNVGIGTTTTSDKLHVIGNVRAGNYTAGAGTYLALTGDLPGYASGAYPTLKSDGTIYLSANGKYSGYFGDGSNTFGINRFSDNLLTTLLHPGGTSYFTGGSVAFGATTAAGGGQVYVASTSNTTKGLVVRGAASQSANLQEWQNSAGTVLQNIFYNTNDTFMQMFSPTNTRNVSFYLYSGNTTSYPYVGLIYQAVSGVTGYSGLGAYLSAYNNPLFLHTYSSHDIVFVPGNAEKARITTSGALSLNSGSSPSAQLHVTTAAATTKGLIVRGASGQSANLQEWQNNAGTALAYVNSAGDFWGTGGAFYTGTGNGTDGYGESGQVVGVSKWLSYVSNSSYFNIRKLYGTRTFPATYANGDYVEIAKIPRQHLHPIAITIHAAHGAVNGTAGKVYVIAPNYYIGSWTAAPLSGGITGDFDFDIEVVAIDAYSCAVRARRHSSATPTYANLVFTIESHNYNRGGMVELSGTGNSATALPYNSDYMRIGPNVSAPPPVGGSGAGTSLAISAANAVTTGAGGGLTLQAGNAAGTGAGGSIILQPGVQATSGGDGKFIIRRPGGTAGTHELQISQSGNDVTIVNPANTTTFSSITFQNWITVQNGILSANYYASGSFNLQSFGGILGHASYGRFTMTNGIGMLAQAGLVSHVVFGVRGMASQTANLQEWQDSAGNVLASIGANGSPQYTSSSPSGYTVDQNNLVLTGSAFQRLSGTAARNITGVAPPTGLSHADGRMLRIYNVGSFNLTLKHNSASSTAANRFFCVQSVDIIIAANDFAELIYDATNNGSGAAGWRVA